MAGISSWLHARDCMGPKCLCHLEFGDQDRKLHRTEALHARRGHWCFAVTWLYLCNVSSLDSSTCLLSSLAQACLPSRAADYQHCFVWRSEEAYCCVFGPHTSTKPGMVRCRTQDYLITSHIGNTLSFWELTPEAELPCVPLATYTPTV